MSLITTKKNIVIDLQNCSPALKEVLGRVEIGANGVYGLDSIIRSILKQPYSDATIALGKLGVTLEAFEEALKAKK